MEAMSGSAMVHLWISSPGCEELTQNSTSGTAKRTIQFWQERCNERSHTSAPQLEGLIVSRQVRIMIETDRLKEAVQGFVIGPRHFNHGVRVEILTIGFGGQVMEFGHFDDLADTDEP